MLQEKIKQHKIPYVLKIRTLYGGKVRYNKSNKWIPAWHDKDYILLHSSFQILVDFMEKEKPGETIDWSSEANHKQAWKEMNRMYRWWKWERNTRVGPWEVLYEQNKWPLWRKIPEETRSKLVREQMKLEAKWDKEDEKNLISLAKIRRYLWT